MAVPGRMWIPTALCSLFVTQKYPVDVCPGVAMTG
jgi:hypothetical protein